MLLAMRELGYFQSVVFTFIISRNFIVLPVQSFKRLKFTSLPRYSHYSYEGFIRIFHILHQHYHFQSLLHEINYIFESKINTSVINKEKIHNPNTFGVSFPFFFNSTTIPALEYGTLFYSFLYPCISHSQLTFFCIHAQRHVIMLQNMYMYDVLLHCCCYCIPHPIWKK